MFYLTLLNYIISLHAETSFTSTFELYYLGGLGLATLNGYLYAVGGHDCPAQNKQSSTSQGSRFSCCERFVGISVQFVCCTLQFFFYYRSEKPKILVVAYYILKSDFVLYLNSLSALYITQFNN